MLRRTTVITFVFFKKTSIVLLVLAIATSGLFAVPNRAEASINQQINYQGKLTDSSNTVVSDGTYSIVFRLYTVASGGSHIWTETQSVTVTNGLFSVMLGSVNSLASVDFNQTLYLGVNVGGDGEMTPRKIIGSVPTAFTSDKLDNLDSTDFLSTSTASAPNLFSLTGLGQIGSTSATTTITGRLASIGDSIFSGLITAYRTITAPNFVATGTVASVFPYASTTAITVSGTASSTGLIVSGLSQLGTVSSGLWNGTTIGVGYGGTGLTSTPSYGQILLGTGSGYTLSATSSLGIALSDTIGILSLTKGGTATSTFANGGIVFSDGTKLTQDTSNFFWDDTNNRLGVGSSTPAFKLSVDGSVAFQGTNFATTTIGSNSTYLTIGKTTLGGGVLDLTAIHGVSSLGTIGAGTNDTFYVLDYSTNPSLTFAASTTINTTSLTYDVSNDRLDFLNAAGGYYFDGDVGIGTSTPFGKVAIVDSSHGSTPVLNVRGDAGSNSVLFRVGAGADLFTIFGNGHVTMGGTTSPWAVIDTNTQGSLYPAIVAHTGGGDDVGFIVDKNFHIGVGTTSPWAKLSIVNTNTNNPNLFIEDEGNDSTPFIIDATGDVGIGTSTPFGKVAIVDSSHGSTPVLNVRGDAGSNSVLFRVGAGADLFTILGNGHVGIGTSTPWAGLAVGGDGSNPAFTASLGDSVGFIIDQNLNVGIGTTSPMAKLSVVGSGYIQSAQAEVLTVEGTNSYARLVMANSSDAGIDFKIGGTEKWSNFTKNNYGGSNVDYIIQNYQNLSIPFVIDGNTDNVGIATTSPWAKLSVDGRVAFQGSNFATTTIGNNRSFLTIQESYSTGGLGSIWGPILKGTSLGTFAGDINAVGINNTLVMYEDESLNNTPSISFVAVDFANTGNAGGITYSTSTQQLVFSRSLYVGDDSRDAMITLSNDANDNSVQLQYAEASDQLNFINATGYYFDTLPQVGSDPMCWDGSGGSLIGDCTSLGKYKTNRQDLNIGLAEIMQLQPRIFDWKRHNDGTLAVDDPDFYVSDVGFIAEEVEEISSWFAKYDYDSGELTGIRERGILAATVNAIKEQQSMILQLEQKISTSTIANFRAIASVSGDWSISDDGVLVVKEIKANKLCLGDTCVEEAQLQQLLNQSGLEIGSSNEDENKNNESSSSSESGDDSDNTNLPIPVEDDSNLEDNNEVDVIDENSPDSESNADNLTPSVGGESAPEQDESSSVQSQSEGSIEN